MRCHREEAMRFYGLCVGCREELGAKFAMEGRTIEVAEYEPKMNVTPTRSFQRRPIHRRHHRPRVDWRVIEADCGNTCPGASRGGDAIRPKPGARSENVSTNTSRKACATRAQCRRRRGDRGAHGEQGARGYARGQLKSRFSKRGDPSSWLTRRPGTKHRGLGGRTRDQKVRGGGEQEHRGPVEDEQGAARSSGWARGRRGLDWR